VTKGRLLAYISFSISHETMDEVASFAELDLSDEEIEDVTPAGITSRVVPNSASPGTSPMFSSPSSTMSGLTGGCGSWACHSGVLSLC
jgi:hypothetical protein